MSEAVPEHLRDFGHWIETYSGLKFHQTHPDPMQIDIQDITHSLSLLCRYNGHVREHYSVGHHVLFVAEMIEQASAEPIADLTLAEQERLILLGLMHDFEEAYTGDIVGSLKMTMKQEIPGFREWWTKFIGGIEDVIYTYFRVDRPTPAEERLIKFFDVRALAIESHWMLPNKAHTYNHIVLDRLRQLAPIAPWLVPVESPEHDVDVVAFNYIRKLTSDEVEHAIIDRMLELN